MSSSTILRDLRVCTFAVALVVAACVSACRHAGDPGRVAAVPAAAVESPRPPTLILLSFDGWRWDYDGKASTPNLQRLIARGVRAERMIPSFPSKTYPNHYTIVTGLYPGHHGVIANNMYDEALGRFSLSDRAAVGDGRWWGGEPIWATAQRQGRRAATYFWPGSEAAINGVRPMDWALHDAAVPNDERVDRMLAWLDRPESERPVLIIGYFSTIDDAGHWYGPESPELRDAATRLDVVLGRLVDGIAGRQLTDAVNIVIVSDHGMSETNLFERTIAIDDHIGDYLKAGTVDIIDIDPTLGLAVRGVSVDEVLQRLKAVPHLRVYRKSETPAHWHYRDHPRVPAIVGVADDGWRILRRSQIEAARAKGERPVGGAHGYDPRTRSMHALFVAAGPSFRRGIVVPPFENVDVYDVLAGALQIQPAPNDGDPATARRVLLPRNERMNTKDTKDTKDTKTRR